MADARERLRGKDEAATRQQLLEPLFDALGFRHAPGKGARDAGPTPDYVLKDAKGKPLTAALAYQWDRWLDGPDPADQQTPDQNPGTHVVSILERGGAEWVIVTNGRLWRLYSRRAHSRSTNFYEVDLAEALADASETDPAEAFRYWWLFFRPAAFAPLPAAEVTPDSERAMAESAPKKPTKAAGARRRKEVAKTVESVDKGNLADGVTIPPGRKRRDGKMSCLDAAAKVLAEAGEPLNCTAMFDRLHAAGYWTSDKATPHNTIYTARTMSKNWAA